jgi:hypothetical protein
MEIQLANAGEANEVAQHRVPRPAVCGDFVHRIA